MILHGRHVTNHAAEVMGEKKVFLQEEKIGFNVKKAKCNPAMAKRMEF